MAIDLTTTVLRIWVPLLERSQPARGRDSRLFVDRGEKRREALHDIPD